MSSGLDCVFSGAGQLNPLTSAACLLDCGDRSAIPGHAASMELVF